MIKFGKHFKTVLWLGIVHYSLLSYSVGCGDDQEFHNPHDPTLYKQIQYPEEEKEAYIEVVSSQKVKKGYTHWASCVYAWIKETRPPGSSYDWMRPYTECREHEEDTDKIVCNTSYLAYGSSVKVSEQPMQCDDSIEDVFRPRKRKLKSLKQCTMEVCERLGFSRHSYQCRQDYYYEFTCSITCNSNPESPYVVRLDDYIVQCGYEYLE